MIVRAGRPADADALAELHVDSWRAAYRGLVPDSHLAKLDCARRADRFRKSLGAGSEETYVVEEGGAILGFATIGECRDDDLAHHAVGEIWGIYVAPKHWRKGVGRELCRHGENLLVSRGCRLITLWVLRDNRQARSFYERMGFSADGESKVLDYGSKNVAVRYRKRMDEPERGTA